MRTALLVLSLCVAASAFAGTTRVRPHVRKNGSTVQPHVRTSPNKTQRDNWSSKPNTNPYTGKAGTKTPKK